MKNREIKEQKIHILIMISCMADCRKLVSLQGTGFTTRHAHLYNRYRDTGADLGYLVIVSQA